MGKKDRPPIEAVFGGLFINFFGISFLILSALRGFGVIRLEPLFLTYLSISGFSFALTDYFLIALNDEKEERKRAKYLLGLVFCICIGVMSIIVFPHTSILDKCDLNLLNDTIVLTGLGLVITVTGVKHWQSIEMVLFEKEKDKNINNTEDDS